MFASRLVVNCVLEEPLNKPRVKKLQSKIEAIPISIDSLINIFPLSAVKWIEIPFNFKHIAECRITKRCCMTGGERKL